MRQPVVIVPASDLVPVLIWAACVEGRPVCVASPTVLNSPGGLRLARLAVEEAIEGTNIEPVWPWESDAIAEG